MASITPDAIPELSTSIVDTTVDPTVSRIGVVTEIDESSTITVAISGSNTLITASYLFPQYQPLLADRVLVQRQGATWWVLGTLSGSLNTFASNPSFEDGTVGSTPTDWTFSTIDSTGGTGTFQKTATTLPAQAVSGSYTGKFDWSANGTASSSEFSITSATAPAAPGERWTLAYFLAGYGAGNINVSIIFDGRIEFLDSGGGSLGYTVVSQPVLLGINPFQHYVRPATAPPYVIAPASTDSVRAVFYAACLHITAGSTVFSVYLDDVLLRKG